LLDVSKAEQVGEGGRVVANVGKHGMGERGGDQLAAGLDREEPLYQDEKRVRRAVHSSSRSSCGRSTGSVFSITASSRPKIAVLAPMAIARMATVTIVNVGARRSCRSP